MRDIQFRQVCMQKMIQIVQWKIKLQTQPTSSITQWYLSKITNKFTFTNFCIWLIFSVGHMKGNQIYKDREGRKKYFTCQYPVDTKIQAFFTIAKSGRHFDLEGKKADAKSWETLHYYITGRPQFKANTQKHRHTQIHMNMLQWQTIF